MWRLFSRALRNADLARVTERSTTSLPNTASAREIFGRIAPEAPLFRFRSVEAHDLGFPIEEIGQLLALWQDRSRASADVKALATARAAELKRKELEIKAMRRSLEELARSCHGGDRPDCPILSDLEGKGHG